MSAYAPPANFASLSCCSPAGEEALIELRTSFDGYELLRSNDEVEETVSSQFISGSPPKKSTSKLRLVPEFSIKKSRALFPTSKLIRALSP